MSLIKRFNLHQGSKIEMSAKETTGINDAIEGISQRVQLLTEILDSFGIIPQNHEKTEELTAYRSNVRQDLKIAASGLETLISLRKRIK
jgi:hypothetical protein